MAGQMPVVVVSPLPPWTAVRLYHALRERPKPTARAFSRLRRCLCQSRRCVPDICSQFSGVAQPAGYLRSLSPAMLMPIPPLCCSWRSKLSSCQSRMGDGQVAERLLSSLVDGNPFGRLSGMRHSYRTGSEVAPLKPPNHLCCRACSY